VEDRDRVDTLESSEDLGALGFRIDRTLGPLVAADRRVRVQPDDEQVAVRAGGLQIAEMPGMQKIEHAVREDDLRTRRPGVRHEPLEIAAIEDAARHDAVFLNRTSPENRQLWRGR